MPTKISESDVPLVKSLAESFMKVPLTIFHILALRYSTLDSTTAPSLGVFDKQ